jgi:hypothetical protein
VAVNFFLLSFLAVAGCLSGLYCQVKACLKVAGGEQEVAGHFFSAGFLLGAGVVYSLALQGWPNPHLLALLAGFASGVANLLYFIPSIVASERFHQNALAILALNFLLGWSFVGWAGALVWALMKTNTSEDDPRPLHAYAKPQATPDDGKIGCWQCGRRVARAFLCTDGRCQRCYEPSWRV